MKCFVNESTTKFFLLLDVGFLMLQDLTVWQMKVARLLQGLDTQMQGSSLVLFCFDRFLLVNASEVHGCEVNFGKAKLDLLCFLD